MKLIALIAGMTLPLVAVACGGSGNEPTGVAGQDLTLPGFPDGGFLPPLPQLPTGFPVPDGGFVLPKPPPNPFAFLFPDGGFVPPTPPPNPFAFLIPDGGFVLPALPSAFTPPPLPSGLPPLPSGLPQLPPLPTGFPLPSLPDGGFPHFP
jgi:hypothetical protein